MSILFGLLRVYGVLDKISFDLSLARGLDYYTGLIYEAIVEDSSPPGFRANEDVRVTTDTSPVGSSKKQGDEEEVDESQVGIGSIAAGGRYDNLVGAFLAGSISSNPNSKEYKKALANSVPCVGVSIGMDRIFALVWPRYLKKGARAKDTMAFVMSAGDGLLEERVGLVRELREAGVKVRSPCRPRDSYPCLLPTPGRFPCQS
jgi:histidyl-tRNA synthetase